MKRIGEHLQQQGLVSENAIEAALKVQERTGSRLGEILQSEGEISSYKFYKEYAQFRGVDFINLEETEVNNGVMVVEDRDEYQQMQYLPFDVKGGVYQIAAADDSDDMKDFLEQKYKRYTLFITSPYDILWALQRRFNQNYQHVATEQLFENLPFSSSKFIFDSAYSKILLAAFFVSMAYFLTNQGFLILFLFAMNLFFLSSLVSKLIFFGTGFAFKKELLRGQPLNLDDRELPVYSVLVPLYHEKRSTIERLLTSLKAFDYPNEKLDIKLICEVNDLETIGIIKELRPSANYQIIRVPEGYPKTKPKACNYALQFCKGEFVTIYDAEDAPDPQQLRKVLTRFSEPGVSCVQARLNYYNREENALTQLFSIEYASWFDYMLYGLQKMRLPIPLGGTSNHFRVKMLKNLYAWDPYNVTEDADLGIRLALAGLRTEVVDSVTLEESPITIKGWMHQRQRWIKGYLQTYLVHMRSPIEMFKKLGAMRFLGFFFFVGAPGIIYLTVPIVCTLTILAVLFDLGLPEPLVALSYFNLQATLLLNFAIGAYIVIKNKWYKCGLGMALFPIYWVLHCIASFGAAWQLMLRPHHWNKTEHGLSKFVQ